MNYEQFLENKKITPIISGFDVELEDLNNSLFDFQRVIVKWALKRGRAAIFADTGLGKTLMQTSWAQSIVDHTDGDVLIVAPLCVAQQTVREGEKFGISINFCRDQENAKPGINITNYEMLDRFNLDDYHGIVLDESSIIKNRDGKTRNAIIAACQTVPYRLSCTATPSPNDFMELGNQSEFLGIMSMTEMLAMFFINDAGDTGTWILKGHGKAKFWEWLSTWSCVIRSPADLGFDGSAYVLPKLNMFDHVVESKTTDGLFADIACGLMDRNKARKESIDDRVKKCAEVINASSEQWVIWCHRNEEAEKLVKLIDGAVDVAGSDSIEHKEQSVNKFIDGSIRVIVSKPKILGAGMNFQHCHNTAFVGLSDSWEQYYQAIRRFYRFGQTEEVNVHVISAESEGAVVANIKRKEEQNAQMGAEMVKYMSDSMKKEIFGAEQEKMDYVRQVTETANWTIHNADCIDLSKEIPDESIDFTIYSPPFESLFTYSNSDRDMGNNKSTEAFQLHYQFLIEQNYRMMKSGRLVAVHCMNLTTSKANDGFIGIRDFRGDIIRAHQSAGFIYHSEVCIWKDPVVAMQRTKALGLLHKTIKKDSSMSRQGLADYLVIFRKPGQNEKPISHTSEEFPVQMWQRYASPVWFDIDQSRTLNFRDAREDDDVKHICPMNLQVIRRCIRMYSAPGEVVLDPFNGIGSSGVIALERGRKYIGIELKQEYFDTAISNLEVAKPMQLITDFFKEKLRRECQ